MRARSFFLMPPAIAPIDYRLTSCFAWREKSIIFILASGEVQEYAMAQMTATPVATRAFLRDGKWIEEGDPIEIRAPYDGSVVGRVFQGTREHAEAAITAAVKAFSTTRRLPAFERQRVLRRVA